jgi:hypothetical protein
LVILAGVQTTLDVVAMVIPHHLVVIALHLVDMVLIVVNNTLEVLVVMGQVVI